MYHNAAPQEVALRLYGINKWVRDMDIDIVLHIHFNDYPRSATRAAGEYSGFAIYVPEGQYYNSTTTKALAGRVFKRLEKYNAASNFAGESAGIIEDQELIAIGPFNSLDAASMLIEYGYIYEPQFANRDARTLAMKDLAFQTYLGLQDLFDPAAATGLERTYATLMLPYRWTTEISDKNGSVSDIFALQSALVADGAYPPGGKTKNECPRTGKLGGCTKAALKAFQEKYGVEEEKGMVGAKTLEVLNRVYGTKI